MNPPDFVQISPSVKWDQLFGSSALNALPRELISTRKAKPCCELAKRFAHWAHPPAFYHRKTLFHGCEKPSFTSGGLHFLPGRGSRKAPCQPRLSTRLRSAPNQTAIHEFAGGFPWRRTVCL